VRKSVDARIIRILGQACGANPDPFAMIVNGNATGHVRDKIRIDLQCLPRVSQIAKLDDYDLREILKAPLANAAPDVITCGDPKISLRDCELQIKDNVVKAFGACSLLHNRRVSMSGQYPHPKAQQPADKASGPPETGGYR
jgi:hypothetical protein